MGVTASPGTSIAVNGSLQACIARPGTGQRALSTLTSLPGWLMWGCVLFLLGRVLSVARRAGPFTARTAVAMRRLGWLIIAAGRQPRKRASDLMIAATAASNALPLYTANPGDFNGAEAFAEVVGVQGRPANL